MLRFDLVLEVLVEQVGGGLVVLAGLFGFTTGPHDTRERKRPLAQGHEPLCGEVAEPAVGDAVDPVEGPKIGVEVVQVADNPSYLRRPPEEFPRCFLVAANAFFWM